MAEDKCPTCHSNVSEDQSLHANRRRGAIVPGAGVGLPDPALSSSDISPLWTDDPIRNPSGFNGDEFVGVNKISAIWFEELQEVRGNEEIEIGIPEDKRTVFSAIRNEKIGVKHFTELRESIEKILNASGTPLNEYFVLDQSGDAAEANPNDTQNKSEWTDVVRGQEYTSGDGTHRGTFELPDGTTVNSPTFPSGTHIKTVHIEDLRHPIQLSWREFWSVTPAQSFYSFISDGNKSSFSVAGLEPQPTDAGARYSEGGNKLWLLRSATSVGVGNPVANTSVSVINTGDSNIQAAKSGAKFIRMQYEFTTTPATLSSPTGNVSLRHNFVDTGPSPQPITTRSINVRKDTHFKVFTRQNGFRLGIVTLPSLAVQLVVDLDGIKEDFVITLILSADTVIAEDSTAQLITAPLTGTQFIARVPTGVPTLNSFLETPHEILFASALEHDLAINIDDYIEALKSYTISGVPVGNFFNYVSQKKLVDSEIVANADATPVKVKSAEISTSEVGGVNLALNRTIDVTGIRIENNSSTIGS